MIRIRDITDPDLRQRIVEMLAQQQDVSPAAIPEWYEMDEADFSGLLITLNAGDTDESYNPPKDARE